MDRIVRQIKEASKTPLPSSRGALQRAVTQAKKAHQQKRQTPANVEKAAVVTKTTEKTPAEKAVGKTSEAWGRKKRKRTAYKVAIKIAIENDEPKEDALQMGRKAYAECL